MKSKLPNILFYIVHALALLHNDNVNANASNREGIKIKTNVSISHGNNEDSRYLNLSQLFSGVGDMLSINLTKLLSKSTNAACEHDILKFVTGLNDGKMWAISMLDAFGKPPAGIIYGSIFWEGSYQECLDVSHMTHYPFDTQFCVASIRLLPSFSSLSGNALSFSIDESSNVPLGKTGICMPGSCSEEDIRDIVFYLHGLLPANIVHATEVADINCLPLESEIWQDKKAVASIAVCCAIALLMLVGTVYDVFMHQPQINARKDICKGFSTESFQVDEKSDKNINDLKELEANVELREPTRVGFTCAILVAFSVYSNSKKILRLKHGEGSLPCVHGLRVLHLCWIILSHFMVISTTDVLADNLGRLGIIVDSWWFQTIISSEFAVDTFFTISGVLLSYAFLKQTGQSNAKGFPWLRYFMHRFIRLTPSYALVLFVWNIGLIKYLGSGPGWERDTLPGDACENNWWKNLLYIHNFWSPKVMCMRHSWYLSVEMQVYIAMSFILCFIVKRPRVAVAIGFAMFAVGTGITTYMAKANNLPLIVSMEEMMQLDGPVIKMFETIHMKPWSRIGPYLIGLVLGWVLHSTNCKCQINKCVVWLAWIATISIQLYLVFMGYHASKFRETFTLLHYAFARNIWSIGIAWVIFACSTGYGGIVNNFLSWQPLLPLSRLTYCGYLVHYSLIEIILRSTEKRLHFSELFLVYHILGTAALTYCLAFPISLAVESPIMAVESYFLKLKKRRKLKTLM